MGGGIRVEIDENLQKTLQEIQNLESKLPNNQKQNLLDLCTQSAIESINSQFGLASLIIDSRDGGSVTTLRNFEQGVVANEEDRARHDKWIENQKRDWNEVRQEAGYDKGFKDKRKQDFQTQDKIIDGYTGKDLPKDGGAHIDHITSAKEIETNAAANLTMSAEQRGELARSEENLTYTNASLNQSKGEQDLETFMNKTDKKTGQTMAEKYDIDTQKALELNKKAREYVYGKIDKELYEKYKNELIQTGTKDAKNMALYSAFGVVLRELVQGVMIEVRATFHNKGKESFSEIFKRFKSRLGEIFENLKAKWKDILVGSIEAGITAFLSNLVVFFINLFATTLKKIVSIIRAGFVSLKDAIKVLAFPPNGMSRDEANYQAFKIFSTGIISATSMFFAENLKNLLLGIPALQPFFAFTIPNVGMVADIISTCLMSVVGGILSTIVIYFMDKALSQNQESKIRVQLVAANGVVLQCHLAQSWVFLDEAYDEFFHDARQSVANFQISQQQIQDSQNKAYIATNSLSNKIKDLKNRRKR